MRLGDQLHIAMAGDVHFDAVAGVDLGVAMTGDVEFGAFNLQPAHLGVAGPGQIVFQLVGLAGGGEITAPGNVDLQRRLVDAFQCHVAGALDRIAAEVAARQGDGDIAGMTHTAIETDAAAFIQLHQLHDRRVAGHDQLVALAALVMHGGGNLELDFVGAAPVDAAAVVMAGQGDVATGIAVPVAEVEIAKIADMIQRRTSADPHRRAEADGGDQDAADGEQDEPVRSHLMPPG